jgi:hypothetical protein
VVLSDTNVEAKEVLDETSAAFRSGDLARAMQCFSSTDDIAYAGSGATELAVGADQVERLLSALFMRDEKCSWTPIEVTTSSLGDGLCLVCAELIGHSERPETSEDFPYRITGLLRRGATAWHWVLLHGSEPT